MPLWVLWWSLGLGAAAAWVITGHQPGLGMALVAAMVWIPALPHLVRAREWSRIVSALLGVVLAMVPVVRDAEWLVVLSLLAAIGLWAVAATNARSIAGIAIAVPSMPLVALRSLLWIRSAVAVTKNAGGPARMLVWLRTVAVTALLLLVFGLLLGSADAVFASFLPTIEAKLWPTQLAVGCLVAVAVLSAAASAVAVPPWSGARLPTKPSESRVAWMTPVVAVAALMGAFLVVQVVAAIGGDDYVLRTAGLTYASYARQGFGQLVAVTALTLAMVSWFAVRAPSGRRADWIATRASLGGLCLMALAVVVTALSRMALYVGAYGLTELRILATTGELVMAAILIMVIIAGIRGRGDWVPVAAVHAAAVAMLALAVLNPDALMVRYNTQAHDTDVDLAYLGRLSADAVPAIDALPAPMRTCGLAYHQTEEDPSIWGWNWARAQAAELDQVEWDGTLIGEQCPSQR